MIFSLKGKSVIVTGGGSGIGKAIALLFAEQGAHVCILEKNAEAASQTVDEITKAGGLGSSHSVDVANQFEVVSVINTIQLKEKRIDILVNSAGIAHIGKLGTTSELDFDRIFNVNVKGTYNSMFAVIRHMSEQKSGVILNLASVASIVGIADRFAYSMSKGAVASMTLSVAKDYIKDGIRCNCISPGRVHTPFVDGFIKANYPGKEEEMFDKLSKTQPIGRMAKPVEIAHLALYLCSDEASFVTGSDYPIDGGFIKLNT
ncbi:MAG: SDR family oxidoreductase [Bacteroidia bacterium]|nr:SDR family oxidoreductase [Bacteroidia bacterium]